MPASDTKRVTVYFDAPLHQALRIKAAHTHRTVSEIVNSAVRQALQEDQEDLEAIEDRQVETEISYEMLLRDLKKSGKL